MRAPGFWSNPPDAPGLAARLLAPLAAVYGAATARRLARGRAGAVRGAVPTICVGNLTAGGAGKTPAVIALIGHLDRADRPVAVVSRGHGGRLPGPVRVDPARHRAADVGDEPLLLAAFAPVWVSRDRAAGLRAAEAAGAGLVVFDDGFQNPAVDYDLRLVVADARLGFGNGRVIPAGPLREPVAVGLARADLLLTVGEPAAQDRFDATWGDAIAGTARLRGEVAPLETGMPWDALRVLAFAGIAYPDKFFATLRGLGAEVVATRALDDHAALSAAMLTRLEGQARSLRAQLVTTEKDAARLPPAWRGKVLTLPVRLNVADWAPLEAAVAAALAHRAA